MKIAISADWHLRGSDLRQVRSQLQELVQKSGGCGMLIVVGDIFDRPSIGDQHQSTGAVAEVAIEAVAAFARSFERHIIMMPGQHDYSGAGAKDALHVFDGMERVSIVREPERLKWGDLALAIVPWMWRGGAVDPAILTRPCDLFLAHVRVEGAIMGQITYEARPGDWSLSRAALEAIPAEHVALGDFHRRQDLTDGIGGYVGALRQLDFGEEGNPQGFEIVDTKTWEVEWVELGQCLYHRTVEVDTGDSIPIRGANERLRVRYLSPPNLDEVRDLEAEGVRVEQVVAKEERIRRAEIPPGVMRDKRELIRLWASTQNPALSEERVETMVAVWEEAHR